MLWVSLESLLTSMEHFTAFTKTPAGRCLGGNVCKLFVKDPMEGDQLLTAPP